MFFQTWTNAKRHGMIAQKTRHARTNHRDFHVPAMRIMLI